MENSIENKFSKKAVQQEESAVADKEALDERPARPLSTEDFAARGPHVTFSGKNECRSSSSSELKSQRNNGSLDHDIKANDSTPAIEQHANHFVEASWHLSNVMFDGSVRQSSNVGRHNTDFDSAALKMLVSNNVAGSIIGRGGQTISDLQNDSNTRIKLSQSGDYYPGTQDRVLLIQGDPQSIRKGIQLLLERFYALQEAQHRPAWQQQSKTDAIIFDFLVRLLVPASSCGMIIGKAGSNIKFMEESTGVTAIRLSPKDEGSSTMERVVTITGPSSESCLQCVYLIFDAMVSHPDIGLYHNMTTSYAMLYRSLSFSSRLLVSSSDRTLSSPLTQQHPENFWASGNVSSFGTSLTRRIASSPDLQASSMSFFNGGDRLQQQQYHRFEPPYSNPSPYRPLGQLGTASSQVPLFLHPGSIDPSLDLLHWEVSQQLHHPHNHLAVSHSASAPNLQAVPLEHPSPSPLSSSSFYQNVLQHSQENQNDKLLHHPLSQPSPLPLQQPHRQSTLMQVQQSPQIGLGSSSTPTLVPQTPTMVAPGCFNAQVLIPDTMIGSILGRGGRTLTELQMLSGTRIRISQRGEHMPGTRSRIVSVRGPTAQTVWKAQFLMSQKMMLPPTASTGTSGTSNTSSTSTMKSSIPAIDPDHTSS